MRCPLSAPTSDWSQSEDCGVHTQKAHLLDDRPDLPTGHPRGRRQTVLDRSKPATGGGCRTNLPDAPSVQSQSTVRQKSWWRPHRRQVKHIISMCTLYQGPLFRATWDSCPETLDHFGEGPTGATAAATSKQPPDARTPTDAERGQGLGLKQGDAGASADTGRPAAHTPGCVTMSAHEGFTRASSGG